MEQKIKAKFNRRPAFIFAVGFVVGALVFAGPKRLFSPLHSLAVRAQFWMQMSPAITANSIRVRSVQYDEKQNSFLVNYTLYGGKTATQYAEAGCHLPSYGTGVYSGDCVAGDFFDANGKLETKRVSIRVR